MKKLKKNGKECHLHLIIYRTDRCGEETEGDEEDVTFAKLVNGESKCPFCQIKS